MRTAEVGWWQVLAGEYVLASADLEGAVAAAAVCPQALDAAEDSSQ
jgi:hypothetical protein